MRLLFEGGSYFFEHALRAATIRGAASIRIYTVICFLLYAHWLQVKGGVKEVRLTIKGNGFKNLPLQVADSAFRL